MKMAITDIKIGERRREALGDIEALARSIERLGLFHPPAVDRDGNLVHGERRVRAFQFLGRTEIEVRVFEDLTEAERREIELEENLRRKDLTPYERSKNLVQLATSAAARLHDQGQTSADFSSTVDEKSPRGRPQRADAEAKVAAELGVAQSTLTLAKQHTKAVARYPELQGLTQREALRIEKELDRLPEDARDQRQAALRDEAAQRESGRGSRGRGRAKRTSMNRNRRDPNERWLKAMNALWRFSEHTRNHAAIVALARRWSTETLRRYLEEVRRVQARLAELEEAFQHIAFDAGMPDAAALQAGDDHTDGTAFNEHARDREPPLPEDLAGGSVQGSDVPDPGAPEFDTVGNDAGAEHVDATESGADGMPDETSDTDSPISEHQITEPASTDVGRDPTEAEIPPRRPAARRGRRP
jgi:hypothetical protein